ncbi:hypothetical protein I4I84_31735 [Pseudonocardia sp. KRD-182]|uniref:hypothetical protein n=1 Tax=Pseudonocardia oceani TaxID=2792013 RepID=UPI001C4A6883|nr:hypothetical protein [Pseudonocardia oceani]MBW0113279.1 hypothetical protein [Pseudonocardia oceani]
MSAKVNNAQASSIKEPLMKHGNHLYLMIGLAVVAGVLYFTGIISSTWALFAFVGVCAVMMMFMMGGMSGRHTGGDSKPGDFADRDR